MAYNREWDMGKEAWHEGGPSAGRGRDEDYGEGKKRKFNGGVCGILLFPHLLTPLRFPHRVGMTEDKTPTKITAWEAADFMATRSASSLATPVRMSSFSVSTPVLRNQTFVE